MQIIEWQFNFSLLRSSLSTESTATSENKVRNFVDKLDKLVHREIDINKESHKQEMTRMQQMLEETLVKNMHLQEDIENMSHEVARLSKLSAPQWYEESDLR